MLTNNNLHIIRIGYKKTTTEGKQAVRKERNKKRYLYILLSISFDSVFREMFTGSFFGEPKIIPFYSLTTCCNESNLY